MKIKVALKCVTKDLSILLQAITNAVKDDSKISYAGATGSREQGVPVWDSAYFFIADSDFVAIKAAIELIENVKEVTVSEQ